MPKPRTTQRKKTMRRFRCKVGEYTIRQLAELIIRLVGNPAVTLVEKPLPADDPKQRCPDITLAKEQLRWEPTIPLEEGLRKTIDWFRSIDIEQYRPPTPHY